jgi:hypothetical protein
MTCNFCENYFQGVQPVVVSIQKSGSTFYLYVQNQGKSIVLIQRILLCYTTPSGGWGVLYLRPPDNPISWLYPLAFLETGISALYYKINAANIQIVQAQAEYVEINGRAQSCLM